MKGITTLLIFLLPLTGMGQQLASSKSIDSLILEIENDSTITKKIYDTVTYEKEDGGSNWDSMYKHKEYFFKNSQIVKIIRWSKYEKWRYDVLAYYNNGMVIKFAKGETFVEKVNVRKLDFEIYYYQDKEIKISWISPKPNDVLGIDTNAFLSQAYSLLNKKI